MAKQYFYIGPTNIPHNNSFLQRFCITNSRDVAKWIDITQQEHSSSITATYIIDIDKNLWITDRHYEHVACAQGKAVLAAGEISFFQQNQDIEIIYISNQSTGYCPEPSCWSVVQDVLIQAEICHPASFSLECIFRRCEDCGQRNIVKDNDYHCAVCNHPLSRHWNF
jgi:hypothetical protein